MKKRGRPRIRMNDLEANSKQELTADEIRKVTGGSQTDLYGATQAVQEMSSEVNPTYSELQKVMVGDNLLVLALSNATRDRHSDPTNINDVR